MPKKNLVTIYEHLFKEGVMVAKKDFHAPKHPELDVPNLQVIKTLTVRKEAHTKATLRNGPKSRPPRPTFGLNPSFGFNDSCLQIRKFQPFFDCLHLIQP